MNGLRSPAAGLLVLLGIATAARAQETPVDRAEALVATGKYAEARTLLEQWWKDADGGLHAEPAVRARALLLRARLTPDPDSAADDYLAVILGYPTTPEAAQALLYLGQGLLATGEVSRAIGYLSRLASDYPGNAHRATGFLWLARAQRAAGNPAAACAAANHGLRLASREPDLLALLRTEKDATCTAAATDTMPPATGAPAPLGPFTVQTGAFREPGGAHALAERLRQAGYEPRLVYIPGSRLLRVRVGRFSDANAAEEQAARLHAAGFAAIVVADAAKERATR
ncbi:MAG TPA: SPOR domain-containing protein [Longimicrobiales bacterium]